jgi:dTDP-4-dehydrorhamnose 3,5-epimerase
VAEFLYKSTDYYSPEHEHSLYWNDPTIGVQWPLAQAPILAAKDQADKTLRLQDLPRD